MLIILRNLLFLPIIVLLFNTGGCATAISLSIAEEQTKFGSDCNVPRVYSGSDVDICGLTAENLGLFALIDLPLSFVVDTILLPYTIYSQQKYGYISVKDLHETKPIPPENK